MEAKKKRAHFYDIIDFAIFTKTDTNYLTLFWEYLTMRGSPTGLPYDDARYAVWMKLLPFMLEVASPASKYRLCACIIFGRTKMRRRRPDDFFYSFWQVFARGGKGLGRGGSSEGLISKLK
jgi:hypothetical protein